MEPPDTQVIHTQGLSKAYNGTKALNSPDLHVPKNTIFGFLGPNGAGKNTTIKMLLGLTRPTEGKAYVFGQDIAKESLMVRKRVVYLAQDPRYYEHMTARQTLRYTTRFFYRGPKDLIEARVEEMLKMTLMLGTLFNTRGPIIGIAIAFIIAGLLLKDMFPPQVLYITPWLLPDIASSLTLGMPLSPGWQVPIAVTAMWLL